MSVIETGRFMYFAFGSNLLKERLQLANPTAIFCSTGRLKAYKLNFGLYKKYVDNLWHGGVATIESCRGLRCGGHLDFEQRKPLEPGQVVCLGAEQNGLPVDYLKRLQAIETNNYSGPSLLDQIATVTK
ncbi:hypothetical protein F7725_025080 [Dissostichus mawsoni]|uniref:Gamma-glutamylcyclotransferase n=1 Tax=Dissostichus mawsoni TaxID=36200 RepID=A0A7J5XA46_DISMA|nr:hypothetical protein F7725_025080 [Dissostichus mawsoni]